jgi:nucleoside-diphosphate-sugar epimerase
MRALVCGGGGFIGNHLVNFLKRKNYWVRAVDIKYPEYNHSEADEFIATDLRDPISVRKVLDRSIDVVYQLAADMGGAGYIFTGEHDADVMHNSATINLNILDTAQRLGTKKVFYSSSACMYPEHNQLDPNNPNCEESSAYPANPDSEYGWEKLFSERLYLAYNKNYKMSNYIARFHNIYGPYGSWDNGKEKAPAAICRKVAQATDGGEIEIWGDGEQTRSFLYVDECLEGVDKLIHSSFFGPVNIGSEERVTINQLVDIVSDIAGKKLVKKHIKGPTGVRGRCSDNRLIEKELNWKPKEPLVTGLEKTYAWIEKQVQATK